MVKINLTKKDLERLRKIFCTLDDETLCSCYRKKGITESCMDYCPGFYKIWAELQKMLEVS